MVDMLKQYGCNCLILEVFLFMSQKVNFSIFDCLLFIVDARYVQGHGCVYQVVEFTRRT